MPKGRNLKQTLRDTCQGTERSRRLPAERVARAFVVVVVLGACARSGIDPWDLEPFVDDGAATGGTSGASSVPRDASTSGAPSDAAMHADAPMDADAATDADAAADGAVEPTVPPDASEPEPCMPQPEACNGRDDDCNGQVDDLAGEPCESGGFRYCIAGRMSECPRSCEVCVPGSLRVCQNNYCTFWGEQECAADGRGFGPCRERRPPARCEGIARRHHSSPELEQCCIDDGYCCLDQHDLDGDGDRREMLGACDGVRCP
jgi:hypothetical protein